MSFGGDPDYKFPDCRHTSLTPDGYCNECGCRAAIMIRLEKREPMNGDITFAIEEFEAACDEAIRKLGGANVYNILAQRRERAEIIERMAPKEKNVLGGREEMMKTRGVSQAEAAHAKAEAERQQYAEDIRLAEDNNIKALNKSMGL